MFKFNFDNKDITISSETIPKESDILWYDSKEIEIPLNITSLVKTMPRNQLLKVDYGHEVTCLSAKEVMNMLKEKSVNEDFIDALKADKEHSDLLPGKYEGGLKTWECTKDLALYFLENEIKVDDGLKNRNILDLGCGSGILGIISLFYGGNVVFQDYNEEVLLEMTIPNIFLNLDESAKSRIKLFSGDWFSFLDLVVERKISKFDYILTSETIYNPENYIKIIQIIKKLLRPNGIAFVAAKTHYFGVGGSIVEFQSCLEKDDLISTACWETNEGVARKILKVTLPP